MTEPYTPSVKGAREDLRDWLRRYRTARNRKRDLDNRLKNVLADLNDPPLGGQGSGSPGSGTPSAGAAAIAYKIDEVEQHRRPARRSDHIPGGRPEPSGQRNNKRCQLRKRI